MQPGAPDELKMFSQAGSAPLSGLPGYAYDSMGGRGITVYVLDTGINPDHQVRVTDYYQESMRLTVHFQEFRNMQGSIRWLYLPDEPAIPRDETGHGTCVASKVVGPAFGVAKSADIVVVKIHPINGILVMSRAIAGWGVVARDIASKSMQRKAVICVTLSGEQSWS